MSMDTVLILGAGASWPYGFPLGSELIGRVANLLPSSADGPMPSLDATNYLTHMLRGYEPFFLRNPTAAPATYQGYNFWGFRNELSAFRSRLENRMPASIDSFLTHESSAAGDHYRHIGKLAIAAVISAVETGSGFNVAPRPNASPNDWYPYLWNQINSFLDSGGSIADLPLKIVTFNYDRSLEQFLALRFAAKYARAGLIHESTEAHWLGAGVKAVSELSIVHVYGSLGALQEERYAQPTNMINLPKRAERIKVIGEDRSEDNFDKAREWLAKPIRVVFLGFGFDKQNMTLLGLNGFPMSFKTEAVETHRRRIFATTFGLHEEERAAVISRYFAGSDTVQFSMKDDHAHTPITTYLRSTGALRFFEWRRRA